MSSRELQLIVNADDFGQSDDTVEATVECFEAGAVTSATVMPGMPATNRAWSSPARTLSSASASTSPLCADPLSRPLSDPALVPSLVRADGTLLSTREVRLKAILGRLVPQELEREIEAQVRVVVEAGIPVTHVDSHRHLHKFQPVRRALETVLPRFGIRRVRAVQDVYLSRPWRSPTYWLGRRWGNSLDRRLRSRFLRLLPWLVVGEWLLGLSALRYVLKAPEAREAAEKSFE